MRVSPRGCVHLLCWLTAAGHLIVGVGLACRIPVSAAFVVAALSCALSASRLCKIVWDPPRAAAVVRWIDLPLIGHVSAGLFGLTLWPAVLCGVEQWAPHTLAGGSVSGAAVVSYGLGWIVAVWAMTGGRLIVRGRRMKASIAELPQEFHGYRIAHLSDLHVGSYDPPERARRWLRRAMAFDPDLLVVTGDLVTSGTRCYESVAQLLARHRPRDGVLVVSGNHDLWDLGAFDRILTECGVSLLDGKHTEIRRGQGRLVVAGVAANGATEQLLARGPAPTVLLAHYPEAFRVACRHGVPLTLSGHTHGGQLAVPFLDRILNIARLTGQPMHGWRRSGRSQQYVSAGLGTTGFPLRIGVPPEVALIELEQTVAVRPTPAKTQKSLPAANASGSTRDRPLARDM